jgi:hypothetical protein
MVKEEIVSAMRRFFIRIYHLFLRPLSDVHQSGGETVIAEIPYYLSHRPIETERGKVMGGLMDLLTHTVVLRCMNSIELSGASSRANL